MRKEKSFTDKALTPLRRRCEARVRHPCCTHKMLRLVVKLIIFFAVCKHGYSAIYMPLTLELGRS